MPPKKETTEIVGVAAAMDEIHKKFGTTAIMKMGDKPDMDIEVIPSGNLLIDEALGVRGYPKGRIIEVFGPESSGKTTLALHAAAEAQRAGGVVAYVDAEHALDPTYAAALGVDIDELLISQPGTGEEALEIVDMLSAAGGVALIVVDSVAALTPKSEIEGEMGDSNVGKHARLMSQAMRKIVAHTNQTKTTVIFINQLREKIGVMFGSPEVTTGGRALKFYSTIRIDIRKFENNNAGTKENPDFIGNKIKIKVAKNKVAAPFKVVELALYYGEGFSNEMAILELGQQVDVVKKAGAWYTDLTTGEQIGQGAEKARAALKDDPENAARLVEAIREALTPSTLLEEPEITD
jgi:recombination protein RecA